MPDDLTGTIQLTRLEDALSERYLAYALSTIMSRSLPDVRDGLRLTGHFLARDAFGQQHRDLPAARIMLADRIAALAGS